MPPSHAPASATLRGVPATDPFPRNAVALVRRKPAEEGEHQAARGGAGIELLGHAPDAHSQLLQFGDGVQNQARLAAEPVQLVNQKLVEFAKPGITQDLTAFWPLLQRDCAGNAIVSIDAIHRKAVQRAVPLREVALRVDGLALALFVGTDAEISGYGHG